MPVSRGYMRDLYPLLMAFSPRRVPIPQGLLCRCMDSPRCKLDDECLPFWHGFRFRSSLLEAEYNEKTRRSLRRATALYCIVQVLWAVLVALRLCRRDADVASHLFNGARGAVGLVVLAATFADRGAMRHPMIAFSAAATSITACNALAIFAQPPGLVAHPVGMDLPSVVQNIADDPPAAAMLQEFVRGAVSLDVYTMQLCKWGVEGGFMVYMGFGRSTLLMAAASALCLGSGALVPASGAAVVRMVGFLCAVAGSVGLSVVVSRHRRLQFLVQCQFEADLATARKADSMLNHMLKCAMAEAADEIEMFLQKLTEALPSQREPPHLPARLHAMLTARQADLSAGLLPLSPR